MIKVKIANKTGTELERELPMDIHQLYHDMREAGISKPPKNILLHDDKDVEVTLSSDSEIGSRLLRVFGRNDPLADANTVAFAVNTAREEILTDLEQNIVHNQYLTKERLLTTSNKGPKIITRYKKSEERKQFAKLRNLKISDLLMRAAFSFTVVPTGCHASTFCPGNVAGK